MHAARSRLARLERPLLVTGLALITVHLLDLALSGPDTLLVALLAIVAVPLALLLALPHATRATRFAVPALLGVLFTGFTAASDLLHAVLQGPAWTDVTGLGALIGGLLLIGAGIAALAAPGGGRPRVLHALLWVAGAAVTFMFVLMLMGVALLNSHSPRNPVHESALTIAHEEVRVPMADGGELGAWYVPSRNRAAVVLIHGATGNRARVADRVQLLARHGYGVLAIDLPGHGESDGHSSELGANAQPAVDAALDYLQRRPDVDPARIAGFGVSLGGEVLLEGTSYDSRLAATISDGAARSQDAERFQDSPPGSGIALGMIRGISGMRPVPSLYDVLPEIGPRPVLLIGAGGEKTEIPVTRAYAEAVGPTAQTWEIPEAGHTGGLRARPAEYERRVIGFLDEALGLGGRGGRDL
jgi:pimeloyl-ACP methyl ester carboxylesterase